MSTSKKERNKDITNFHHLCKDLFKYIKRKILKKYVEPETTSTNKNLDNYSEETENWKYYNTEEKLTEEDKIYDIYKDNSFLVQVQKLYECIEKVIASLDENKKNFEFLKKNIEVGEKNIKLLSELNSQLNQYFNSSNTEISNLNCINKQNVIGHLSLVKSFNILNDLKIINSIKDVDTGNNLIDSNDLIDTGIENDNNSDKPNKNKNKKNKGIPKNADSNTFLNKKIKREKKNEKYIELNEQKCPLNTYIPNIPLNDINDNNKEGNKGKEEITDESVQNKKEENNTEQHTVNSLINKINISENKLKLPLGENTNNISNIKENYINLGNSDLEQGSDTFQNNNNLNNNNNSNNNNSNINMAKNKKYKDNTEIEFEKLLKNEFSSIYANNIIESNNDIIQEIKNILNKISQMQFPEKQNKFENPTIFGTYKNIDTKYLLDSLPAIDILYKCKDVKNIDEINDISQETMTKKLCLSYIEICKGYDKESEIVKVTNKCKIKVKDNYFFIYINLLFINVNLSTYTKKEQSINRYMFSNEIYNNKDKVLICLFFRRWRRKYKLFFILPEFLDIIINFYYNENDSIPLIIENIFYDLFNGEINFYGKNIIIDDEKNINEIMGFIGEWYNIPEHKTALNNAIASTNECLLKCDFLSVVKSD